LSRADPGTNLGDEFDPLARAGAVAIAAGRAVIGLGAMFATRPALRALGFSDPSPEAVALARLAGGRDIALGIHALAETGSRDGLRRAAAIGAVVDLGDAAAFGVGLASGELPRGTAALNTAIALSAVGAGAWVVGHLGPSRP